MFFGRKLKQNSNVLTYELKHTSHKGGTTMVHLCGPITEHSLSVFDALLNELSAHSNDELIFNLSAVSFMNSIGIHQWMQFLRKIPASNALALEECPPDIVGHLNLLQGFRGRARVMSFQVPYICTSCQKRAVLLVRTSELPAGTSPLPPACRCGQTMEAEEPEDEYFHFLENL